MEKWIINFVIIILCSKIKSSERTYKMELKEETVFVDFQSKSSAREDVVNELAKRIQSLQIQQDRPYKFPLTWEQHKGLYPSDIKLNIVGKPPAALLRDMASVYDNNMFVTSWVTTCLLEAHLYARGPRPTSSQLSLALEAMGQYHDRNRPFNNSVINFWPQVYKQSTGMWESAPRNMLKAFQIFDVFPMKLLEDILKLLGKEDVEHILESVLSLRSIFELAFHIPPDFDCSFVNLGLGALLKDLGQDFPEAYSLWSSPNNNVTSVLDALKRYAYRPFSQDQNVNTIDTRTFYYIRHFLGDALGRNEDIALVPTWVQNLDEVRKDYFKGVAMPLNMNNVDVTVSANAIYGLTASVLSGLFPEEVLEDPVIEQVYVNTSSMVAYQIQHGLYGRPDLELTYYPSQLEFYWFAARTLSRLETAMLLAPKSLPRAMQRVYSVLKPALEDSMSRDVVNRSHSLTQDMVYFDDFLGDGDVDSHNKTLIRGEDRLFTTSMAINALMSTWTVTDPCDHTIRWKDHTPQDIRTTVEKSVRFLETYILEDTYKPWNVFFSVAIKGKSSLPFGFPANRIEYLNGTIIHDDQHFPKGGPYLFGVQGFIPETQYQILIHQKHFGMDTPTNFTSFNVPGSCFPFWTSTAYTYSTAMLALARFDNIVQD